jgi:hypothetical protein
VSDSLVACMICRQLPPVRVWTYLGRLSEDDEGDLRMLVLLTPDESDRSAADLEFEDPVPSVL